MTVLIVLPLMDETSSLRKTVEIVLAENPKQISEILMIVCKRTTGPTDYPWVTWTSPPTRSI